MVNYICLECQKEFTPKNRARIPKYCSIKCYSIARIGKKLPKEWRENIGKAKLNEKNPMWKGDNVGVNELHRWVKDRKPKPQFCVRCDERTPFDLANISGNYKRDVNDFEWLCRKCHMEGDGRMKNLNWNKEVVA